MATRNYIKAREVKIISVK